MKKVFVLLLLWSAAAVAQQPYATPGTLPAEKGFGMPNTVKEQYLELKIIVNNQKPAQVFGKFSSDPAGVNQCTQELQTRLKEYHQQRIPAGGMCAPVVEMNCECGYLGRHSAPLGQPQGK
jgi:hypothetical protein